MLRTATALAILAFASTAADASTRTITVRGGQGDATTIAVPASAPTQVRPHELTGTQREPARTITVRAGQGGLVQVPVR